MKQCRSPKQWREGVQLDARFSVPRHRTAGLDALFQPTPVAVVCTSEGCCDERW